MAAENSVSVEVVYATAETHWLESVTLPEGSTVADALGQTNIQAIAGYQVTGQGDVGVFSKKVTLDSKVTDGDRIEIYRLLKLSPNEIRLLRAAKKRTKG